MQTQNKRQLVLTRPSTLLFRYNNLNSGVVNRGKMLHAAVHNLQSFDRTMDQVNAANPLSLSCALAGKQWSTMHVASQSVSHSSHFGWQAIGAACDNITEHWSCVPLPLLLQFSAWLGETESMFENIEQEIERNPLALKVRT